jgi:hypothetical protein
VPGLFGTAVMQVLDYGMSLMGECEGSAVWGVLVEVAGGQYGDGDGDDGCCIVRCCYCPLHLNSMWAYSGLQFV